MSLLRKISGKNRHDERERGPAGPPPPPPCPHTAMVPRWGSLEDMGKQDRITAYFCQGCETTFSAEEARPLLR
jgi:hypothetical protein